jgi:lipid II:glycine glycyltransferase (peptidoglycan interpeptide bridge formation enzyme)
MNQKLFQVLFIFSALLFSSATYAQSSGGAIKKTQNSNVKEKRSIENEKKQFAYLLRKAEWSSRLPKPTKEYEATLVKFLGENIWMVKTEYRSEILNEKVIPQL